MYAMCVWVPETRDTRSPGIRVSSSCEPSLAGAGEGSILTCEPSLQPQLFLLLS